MYDVLHKLAKENFHKDKKELFDSEDIALEGTKSATLGDLKEEVRSAASSIKGWFEDADKKRKHINEICEETIEWLKKEDKDNPKLKITKDPVKESFKVSGINLYRYYYLLNETIYKGIVSNLKEGKSSELEHFITQFFEQQNTLNGFGHDVLEKRHTAMEALIKAHSIKDLISVVHRYRSRVNVVFDLIDKKKRKVKGFPFQLLLKGANDLRQTVKRIVNLST